MKHERIFDELSKAIVRPARDWRHTVRAIAVDFVGKLATGLAIGIGIAAGRALAG
ncbi:hypothetical protein NKI89_26170 [Mesorhizobium sp. M0309]|uniref:hypothetical protein n=1 Tax=Mesorhizobium sp. M0309 TaxID=2956933 RepID=UPI00333C07EB